MLVLSAFVRDFGKMKLWTVHPVEVWNCLRDAGEVWVDASKKPTGYLHPPYRWLADQMSSRLMGSSGQLLWFAYCSRPDLRWVRHSRLAGQLNVLIEFTPPPGNAFIFPKWAWNKIFCQQYLALSRDQHREWNRKEKASMGRNFKNQRESLPKILHAELEKSWERLFVPDLPARCSWERSLVGEGFEAVVVVLRLGWVNQVTEFVGTGAWGKIK